MDIGSERTVMKAGVFDPWLYIFARVIDTLRIIITN